MQIDNIGFALLIATMQNFIENLWQKNEEQRVKIEVLERKLERCNAGI